LCDTGAGAQVAAHLWCNMPKSEHRRGAAQARAPLHLPCSRRSRLVQYDTAACSGTHGRHRSTHCRSGANAPAATHARVRCYACATRAIRAEGGRIGEHAFRRQRSFHLRVRPPIRVGSRTGVGPRRPARRRRRAGSRDERMRRSSEKAFTAPDIHTVLYDSYNSVL